MHKEIQLLNLIDRYCSLDVILFKGSFKTLQRKVLVTKDFLKVIKSSFGSGFAKICNVQDDDLPNSFYIRINRSTQGVRYLHKNFNAQIRVLSEEFKIKVNSILLPTVFSLFNPALGVTSVIRNEPYKACKSKC